MLRYLVCALFICLSISSLYSQESIEPQKSKSTDTDEILFTFTIFGDNKIGGKKLDHVFSLMQKVKPSFVIGMGDHYQKKGSMEAFAKSIKKSFGYERFWPLAGDNEDEYWSGEQSNFGSQKPFFHKLGLFGKDGKSKRKMIVESNQEMLDYAARFQVKGMKVNLLCLYCHDSMTMQNSTKNFADNISEKAKKSDEFWIAAAHNGRWWSEHFKKDHALYSCDLLLGGSLHFFFPMHEQGSGKNSAYITSALFREGKSWLAVAVLKDRYVVMNVDDEEMKLKTIEKAFVTPLDGKKVSLEKGELWMKKILHYGKSIKEEWGPMPTLVKEKENRKKNPDENPTDPK